mmetsp:Transcript_35608/g.36317  ORF Transcript_35608/g.36317 Transcript_35608/m.36317 type:complete len:219 (+) Transcript_35608:218-874(+)|eukprot:CAMPEP_0182423896 /NCGR_PEP_ID=MMETSP1167-20130531/9985_1 /TAXON_ID=2988 /ORGANISM="Mallomonas Sp, Strain CCMP3275" /LENGTH=218 /DNA_ID=CAMNT_0024603239 /DNA_START=155 /DNA_END=814 /DNA_ORIENTATION=+
MADLSIEQQLSQKCNFCESAIDQLRSELPKFLNKKAELDKSNHSLAQSLRNVAATESNDKMQECLFNCATKYEELDEELKIFRNCSEQTNSILDEAKSYLVLPLREVLLDLADTRATVGKKHQSSAISTINAQRLKHMETALPLHSKLFEQHRVGYMKGLLTNFLFAELRYHCKALEAISPLVEMIANITEDKLSDEIKEKRDDVESVNDDENGLTDG